MKIQKRIVYLLLCCLVTVQTFYAQNWSEPVEIPSEKWPGFYDFSIDSEGEIHCVYTNRPDGSGGWEAYFLYTSSSNGGQTWNEPLNILEDTTNVNRWAIIDAVGADSLLIMYTDYFSNVISIDNFDGAWGEQDTIGAIDRRQTNIESYVDNAGRVYCTWLLGMQGVDCSTSYNIFENNAWGDYQVPFFDPLNELKELNLYSWAFDEENKPHVAGLYIPEVNHEYHLIYTQKNEQWADIEILSPIIRASLPCISINNQNEPCIVYCKNLFNVDTDKDTIKYVTKVNGVWEEEVVNILPHNSCRLFNLIIDENGVPNIFYAKNWRDISYHILHSYINHHKWCHDTIATGEGFFKGRFKQHNGRIHGIYNVAFESLYYTKTDFIEATEPVEAVHSISFSCYPNPFMNSLNVQYNIKDINPNVALRIFNSEGELVMNIHKLPNQRGRNNYEVPNIDNLFPGVYFLELTVSNKKFTKRLVKQ